MTEEKVIDLLRDILNTIDENEYPEIYSIILGGMDEACGELLTDGYYLLTLLNFLYTLYLTIRLNVKERKVWDYSKR